MSVEEMNVMRYQVKRYVKWSEEEQRILERNAHLSCQAIQRRLKKAGYERSVTAIRDRIALNNLRQDTPYFCQKQLAEFLGVSAQTVRRWMQEGLVKSQRKQTEHPADPRLIHRNEVLRFIKRYPGSIDLSKVDQLWFLDVIFEGRIGDNAEAILREKASRYLSTNLEIAAYHEAGHAVMAYIQGVNIKSLTIGRRADSPKRIIAHPLNNYWFQFASTRSEIEQQILILAAGQIAQYVLTGVHGYRGKDFPYARQLASHLIKDETELNVYLQWLWVRARNILNDQLNWAAVTILAKAISEETEIRGIRSIDECRAKAIVEQTLKYKCAGKYVSG